MAMFVTSFLLVLSTCVFLCHWSGAQIYIEPVEGECCPQNASSCLNITAFGSMAVNFTYSSGMVVYFLEGTHLLDLPGSVVFRGLHNAVFEGLGRMKQGFHETVWQSTVVIRCTKSSGIAFVGGSNVTFKSITITNCGANSSLLFYYVASITVDQVSVQNGSGYGLSVVTAGFDVTISSSSFAQNGGVRAKSSNLAVFYTDPPDCPAKLQKYKIQITTTNVSFGMNTSLALLLNHSSYEVNIILGNVVIYNSAWNVIALPSSPCVSYYTLIIFNTQISHVHGYDVLPVGLYVSILSHEYKCTCGRHKKSVSRWLILNSKFTDNNGGGVYLSLEGFKYYVSVAIESTEISHNTAGFEGSGLTIKSSVDQFLYVTLSNVTINNNFMYQPLARYASAVFVSLVTYLKLNNVSITNNNSTGLLVYNTNVVVGRGGVSVFHNNSGIDGGGLAMFGVSQLFLEEDAYLTFTNNSATERGGAIFIVGFSRNYFSPRLCFCQYFDFANFGSPRLYFSGNKAGMAGFVLYNGGNYETCTARLNYSDQTGLSVIASNPSEVYFCQNNTPDHSLNTLNMTAYPGEEITISVVTVYPYSNGKEYGVAPGVIQLQNYDNFQAINSDLYKTVALKCTNIPIKIPYKGTNFIVNSMIIANDSPSAATQTNRVQLNITVLECPLGFNRSNDPYGTCDCLELRNLKPRGSGAWSPGITCNVTTWRISRQGDIWIGFDNTSNCTVVLEDCPFDYCNKLMVNFTLTDPDPQCAPNRTGTLCGTCRDGLSLSLGSNNCIQCSDSSHIALILPFAAAGFGLVVLLMVLNLTVSTGTINGLIFYANIVKVSESIFFPQGPVPVLSQFISWLNLDLGIEICFFSGMTAYAKVWLQFVFPVYIWFIIATLIVLCHYSTWLSNKIGGNVVQVLATLILLSYTKLFRTIVLALDWTFLSCISQNQTRLVWTVDGTVDYFSLQHVLLLAISLVFLLLAVPYIFALLFHTPIEKYLTMNRLFRKQWVRFKPLIDAYNGPYKDSCRFWTGLLLLARLVFVSLGNNQRVIQFFVITTTVLLLSVIAIFRGIYRKKHLDILECWSLFNLALLFTFAACQWEELGVKISVSLMFATFIGVLVYHTFLRLRDLGCRCRCIKNLAIKKHWNKNSNGTEYILQCDDNIILRAPTTSEVCLRRESLIN